MVHEACIMIHRQEEVPVQVLDANVGGAVKAVESPHEARKRRAREAIEEKEAKSVSQRVAVMNA